VLYLAAQLGQKFAAHHTFQLHEAYERAIAPHRAGAGESIAPAPNAGVVKPRPYNEPR
jgi:hypothetical protein